MNIQNTVKNKEVVVLLGAGSMGIAIVRRIGSGKTILIGDINEKTMEAAASKLTVEGHTVVTQAVDASSRSSIHAFAQKASNLGNVTQYIHTAGVSPAQASAAAVLAVDLAGTAIALEEFANVIAPGGAGIVISSMAGYMLPHFPPEQEEALRMTSADELLKLSMLSPEAVPNSAAAYGISKRANHLRVQAASMAWGDHGARLNSISPGIILTPLAQDELASEAGPVYQTMIKTSAAKRVGTTDEVAAAAAYLLGPNAGFVTGSDLLIDGGVIAAIYTKRMSLQG